MIPVTKPFLPDINVYQTYVADIWKRNWLTNNGPLVNELEAKLKDYLDIQNLLYVTNGTIAIQMAIKALALQGDIITTPFSYVATCSSIVWEGCSPIFVDINATTLNIDPAKIEASITPSTTAILATHCFGNPCDISAIEAIATKHNLKVIYDAAHCFGTLYKGKSVFAYGDISTTSFHATKLYHTTEGGAVFAQNAEVLKTLAYMRNFGHNGPEAFQGLGINGKNSEFHAAMGLAVLPSIEPILAARKAQSILYDAMLQHADIKHISITAHAEFNYAYYPIIFKTEAQLEKVKAALEAKKIFPRRYFYPSLSALPYLEKQDTPISDALAACILCLPLYFELTTEDQTNIATTVRTAIA